MYDTWYAMSAMLASSRELEQAVRSVPGLFGHTEVTDQGGRPLVLSKAGPIDAILT